ncbi:MAG TPA: HlyD family efflux transporter periplasmic adaptor subunit [Alphaproteobacteria bacterium]|nr:HlyD family efflux transporter periplasmic adaptor subunit [Alphaproteobacteria bacterium]
MPWLGTAPIPSWNGYVEADYVYISAASPGTIASIAVREGDAVAAGDVLFTLNDEQYRAILAAAEARVDAAEANLENLSTGSREDEIEVIRASLQKAQADLSLARETSARSGKLFAENLIPQSKYDQDRAALASAEAQVKQLQAQLKVAELPARDAQQAQAEANLAAAKAEAAKARADLAERTVLAPTAGRIERLYFTAGEIAGAGIPVLALLPADALKVKFYVAEADRPGFALDQPVVVTCDGCPEGLRARLSFLASDPQFTPPVIYSRDERRRLTFLAEAVLEQATGLLPGQPVTVARVE